MASKRKPPTPRSSQKRHDVLERLVDLRVVPVQIGLLDVELVVVVLARFSVPLPGRVAEERLPVVGGLPGLVARFALAIAPHVPIAIRIVARGARLDEPLVLIRGVVHHHVHDHADVAFVCLGNQAVEVGQRAVLRIDVAVVRDVVAEVDLRRRIDGSEPDGVDSQVFQVIEPLR